MIKTLPVILSVSLVVATLKLFHVLSVSLPLLISTRDSSHGHHVVVLQTVSDCFICYPYHFQF